MSTRKIPRSVMRDILWENHGGKVLVNEVTSQGRWSVHYRLVFELEEDGLIYETDYSRGATEQQDERPWDYEEEVECHHVEAVEVTTTEYRRVE